MALSFTVMLSKHKVNVEPRRLYYFVNLVVKSSIYVSIYYKHKLEVVMTRVISAGAD